MKSDRIYAAIGAADDDLLLRAEEPKRASSNLWIKFGSLAACLCLAVLGTVFYFNPDAPNLPGRPVLQWSERFAAADYFRYSSGADESMPGAASYADKMAMPYAESRLFSDERTQLEAEGAIPAMAEHPMFECSANYNDDGSIYSVVFSWHKRPVLNRESVDDVYSDLSITAGYQEVEQITDYIFIELDDDGNIVEPAVTVTERDDIQIVAEGNENRNKTITFQNDSGWYQISGSWNDSYASMVSLLDWLWENPIDFARYPIAAGDHFTSIKLEEMPDAFNGFIPDFSAFGFIEETNYLSLKNGEPYAYEGHFIAHAPEEAVKAGTYYDIEGWTIIHWCIMSNPEYYVLPESLGELNELTEQIVFSQFDSSTNQSSVSFTWDGLFIKVYSNTAQELWTVLETLRD